MPVSKVSLQWDQKKVMDAAKKLTVDAAKSCATRLQRRVERYVPVDTGQLRASIRQYKSKKGEAGGYTVFAGDDQAFYAIFVEKGTVDRITNGGRYSGKMKARRFMRKAINEEKQSFYSQLKKDFT